MKIITVSIPSPSLFESFKYFDGTPREIVVDNMMTAVTEHADSIIRFNEYFLDFLRHFKITPLPVISGHPIKKTIASLLNLRDEYGESSLLYALLKALSLKLYG